MVLEKTLIRKVILLGALALGAFVVIPKTAMAQTPSPALLITIAGKGTKGEHSLEIADPRAAKVVGRVPIEGTAHPHEVALSTDGRLAFVSNTFFAHDFNDPKQVLDGYISIIDLESLKEVRRVEVGPDSITHDLVFLGGKLYFTAEGYQLIGRYDLASSKIDWMYGTGLIGTHMMVITKDQTKIFAAASMSDDVIVIEPWDHRGDRGPHVGNRPTMSTVIPVGHAPEGIAISPDEKEVWALNRGDGTVSIIDVADKKVLQIVNLTTKDPVRLAFTPDGKKVLIGDGASGKLSIVDALARKEIKVLTNVGNNLHDFLMVPDGSRAYVSVHNENYVAIIDLKTLELVGRIATGDKPESMVWVQTK
jgi:YVTN family beta-propeller protein